jgi:hypothetical protein
MAKQQEYNFKVGSAWNVPINSKIAKRKFKTIALYLDFTKQSLFMARFALFFSSCHAPAYSNLRENSFSSRSEAPHTRSRAIATRIKDICSRGGICTGIGEHICPLLFPNLKRSLSLSMFENLHCLLLFIVEFQCFYPANNSIFVYI